MSAVYNYIQTFYVDRDRVNAAAEIMLTSIDLYFKAKPDLTKNISGSTNPTVSIWICDINNDQPVPSMRVQDSISVVDYDLVNTSGNAAASTKFTFKNPLLLNTGRYYGLVIKFSDPAYDIWINKQGDRLVDASGPTGTPSPGSLGRFDGKLFSPSSSGQFIQYDDRDLKFKINIAKFTDTTGEIVLVNKNYEFFTIESWTGNFKGGEYVYQVTANATGTLSISDNKVTIVGTGTSFESHSLGQYIVVENGSGINEVLQIQLISNNTLMTVDKAPRFTNASIAYSVPPVGKLKYVSLPSKKLYLDDSNAANSTFKFTAASTLKGQISGATAKITSIDRYQVDAFLPKFNIGNPASANYSITYKLANTSNNIATSFTNLENFKVNKLKENSYILSRSDEVVGSSLFGTNKKSAVANVEFNVDASNTNLFSVPYIKGDDLDFFMHTYEINNTYTETRNGIADYDTEIDRNGLAKSKYISTKISFDKDKYAEDVSVYVTAYRPFGTEIRVYAKLQNSSDPEAFDDKAWTPLILKDNNDKYSREGDESHVIMYNYGLSQYPAIKDSITVDLTVDPANTYVATASDVSSNVAAGDLVRLYDPMIPQNHEVFKVLSVNSTSIGLNKLVTNINIPTNPGLDTLKYKTIAFNNIANDNVVRYYTTSTNQEIDNFNTMQIKIVMLSNSTYLIPKVEQLSVLGVST